MKIRGYWLQRQSVWLRGLMSGLAAFVIWFFFSTGKNESVVFRAVISFVFAAFLAGFSTLQARRLQKQQFGDAGPDERVAMLRALDAGRVPEDERLRERTVDLARWTLRKGDSPVILAGLFGVFFAGSVLGGVLGWGSECWIFAALFAVLAPLTLIPVFRQRNGARRLLGSIPAA